MIKAVRYGITWKILLAALFTVLAAACGTLFLVQWSFDRGFPEYVNRIEREARESFVAALAGAYQRHGNWDFIAGDNRYLRRLYLRGFLEAEGARRHFGADAPVSGRPPGRLFREAGVLFRSRVALLDEDQRVLAGSRRIMNTDAGRKVKPALLPVTAGGETVGYLAVAPEPALAGVRDIRFARHLDRAFLLSAVLMVIVSMALALPLAYRLARPSREPAGGQPGTCDIDIDEEKFRIRIMGEPLDTTVVEFQLFKILAATPGQVWPRARLMDTIYPDHRIVSERTIDSHVKKLRKKIAKVLPQREIIHSVYGAGYKFQIE